ncbi:MAG: HAD family phosphatase [Kiritimatiellae bacterium]|nr:HAD family phosphatase [Kiritimatiellia bacterium]MDW8457714.1 HAD family phosphatase [Verrucomicrobiota bacterium]
MDLGVIFDIDGTLVDNHAYHEEAWLRWGELNNTPISREYYRERLYARTNDQILRTLFGEQIDPDEIARRAAEKEAIYREIYAPAMAPMPGLIDLLRSLRDSGIPCAAASNADRINVDFVIDGLSLRPFFHVVLSRDDVQRGKPDPEMFVLAAARMGVPPRRCLVFEDSATGFEAAARAGMLAIGVAGPGRILEPRPGIIKVVEDYRGLRPEDLRELIHAGLAAESVRGQ